MLQKMENFCEFLSRVNQYIWIVLQKTKQKKKLRETGAFCIDYKTHEIFVHWRKKSRNEMWLTV